MTDPSSEEEDVVVAISCEQSVSVSPKTSSSISVLPLVEVRLPVILLPVESLDEVWLVAEMTRRGSVKRRYQPLKTRHELPKMKNTINP